MKEDSKFYDCQLPNVLSFLLNCAQELASTVSKKNVVIYLGSVHACVTDVGRAGVMVSSHKTRFAVSLPQPHILLPRSMIKKNIIKSMIKHNNLPIHNQYTVKIGFYEPSQD